MLFRKKQEQPPCPKNRLGIELEICASELAAENEKLEKLISQLAIRYAGEHGKAAS